MPHGVGLHGAPNGDSSTSRFMPYGVPRCGLISLPGSAAFARAKSARGIRRDDVRGAAGVDIDDAARIDGDAAPVDAAAGEREDDACPAGRGRRVEAVAAQRRDALAAGGAVERREAERVLGSQLRRHQRRQVGRKGLRRRERLRRARRLAAPRAPRPERPAGRCRGRARTPAPAWSPGRRHRGARRRRSSVVKRRLRRHVVVPDVVLDDLERPREAAVGDAQRDDRIGVPVRAGALAAVEVGARARGRQEDQPARLVDRHRRPDVGGADVAPGLAPALRRRIGRVARHRVPRPAQRAAARVERAHLAGRCVDALVVGDRRADDDDAAGDDRRRRDAELARTDQRAGVEPDLAAAGRNRRTARRCAHRARSAGRRRCR